MPDIPDSHHDLLDSRFATLAPVGADGRPQLSEVWFVRKGDSVAISLNSSRQKTKNLMRRPACTLFILDLANRYYLELRGDAELLPDVDYRLADRVGDKYGADLREHDRTDETRVVVWLRPIRVNAVNMRG